MNTFFSKVSAFVREEEGLTMVEYAIGAAVIGGMALALFTTIGTKAQSLNADAGTTLDAADVAAKAASGKAATF